ncbi:hypothetical protein OUZ56_032441 [Daphnia magna]|uniref:CSD domain-containing protein n=1 Tax=Daphnia magna TaxID=35525 RepID=A0ABR0B8Y7_9CRUS|nr:hypothetical protein OUZ56_032441 [Daphnia magna]
MAVGRVKWFNDEKGWGFIKQDEGPDVFVHYSQIAGDGRKRLYEDELVQFELKEGPKGLQAVDVRRETDFAAGADRHDGRFGPRLTVAIFAAANDALARRRDDAAAKADSGSRAGKSWEFGSDRDDILFVSDARNLVAVVAS